MDYPPSYPNDILNFLAHEVAHMLWRENKMVRKEQHARCSAGNDNRLRWILAGNFLSPRRLAVQKKYTRIPIRSTARCFMYLSCRFETSERIRPIGAVLRSRAGLDDRSKNDDGHAECDRNVKTRREKACCPSDWMAGWCLWTRCR
jgi:hypothetical protein